jgi:hypothetical protein
MYHECLQAVDVLSHASRKFREATTATMCRRAQTFHKAARTAAPPGLRSHIDNSGRVTVKFCGTDQQCLHNRTKVLKVLGSRTDVQNVRLGPKCGHQALVSATRWLEDGVSWQGLPCAKGLRPRLHRVAPTARYARPGALGAHRIAGHALRNNAFESSCHRRRHLLCRP